jgi:flagellar basal-body rod protein FlgF
VPRFGRFAIPLFGAVTILLRDLVLFSLSGIRRAFSSNAMDPLTAVAASGLRARMESLEMLANNVANASTAGYKSDREFYSLYLAPEANTDATMPLVERPWTDFSQGTLRATGNSLDLALAGKGFFGVNGPSGPLYTRSGAFRIAPTGMLVSSEGYPVRGAGGTVLNVAGSSPLEISTDGTVRQAGNIIGQLEIADFTSTAGLVKQGNNYFRAGQPPAQTATPPGTAIQQGHLEESNTGSAEAAVRLIGVMRQFEMLQKAVALGADMNQHAIQEVARVGS